MNTHAAGGDMRELLTQIRKDAKRWECHPLLEDCCNDFRVGSHVRKYWPETTELLFFGNELMEVKMWLRRDTNSRTWAIDGKLSHQFSIFKTFDWPESLAQRYVSARLAAKDLETSARASLQASDAISREVLGVFWDEERFSSGQRLTITGGDLAFIGNRYPRVMPPRLTARLFRSELTLACVWLLRAYVGYYKGMIPRLINEGEIDTALRRIAGCLFTAEPLQMLVRRAPETEEANTKEVAKAKGRSEENSSRVLPDPFAVDDELEDKVVRSVEASLEIGDTAGAEAQIESHLAAYPQSNPCRYRLARIYLWTGRPDQAAQELRRLVEIYLEVGWLWNAFDILERLETITPDDPFLYFRKAFIYDRKEYFRSAATELQKAGRIFLQRGDTAGLEQFRERMIGVWWEDLPSLESLAAESMLRLDFSRDFKPGYYYRNWIPAKYKFTTARSDRREKIVVPLDELLTLRATKKQASRYEKKGQVLKGAAIHRRLARIYEGYNLQVKAIHEYELAIADNPDWTPVCLDRVAQLYRERYRHRMAANIYRELARYHQDRNETDKAEEATRNADDIDQDIARAEEFDFSFDNEASFNFNEPNFGGSVKAPDEIVKFDDNDQELDFSTLQSD